MPKYLVRLVLTLSLGVVGCGESSSTGGSGGDGSTRGEPNVGRLIGPVTAGVDYETATQRGVTDTEGRFRYEEGEMIRFLLGSNLLGEVLATSEVTPFELTGAPRITGTLRLCDALGAFVRSLWLPRTHPCYNRQVPYPRRNPVFNALVNLVVLLQTLDEDGNVGNGIEITPEIRALVGDAEIDLTQSWEDFADDFPFRRVIGDANERGLFSRVHGAINPAPALQHLYDSLGIDPGIGAIVVASTDHDLDGRADSIERFEYNPLGYWTHREKEDAGDGDLWEWDHHYDAAGNRTGVNSMRPGREDVTTAIEYDALGYPVRYVSSEIRTFERDKYGNLTKRMDSSGVMTWAYDDEGRKTEEQRRDADGNPRRTTSWTYDDDGELVRKELIDANGTRSYVTTREHDEEGNLVREERIAADGTSSYVATLEYDTNGNLTRHIRDGADGNPDWIEMNEYEYGDMGHLVRSVSFSGGDFYADPTAKRGTVLRETEYDVDDTGNVIRSVSSWVGDFDGDGVTETYTHETERKLDEGGKVLRGLSITVFDFEGDGLTTTSTVENETELNEAGNVVRSVRRSVGDFDGDGIAERGMVLREFEYDAEGRERVKGVKFDEDGNPIRAPSRMLPHAPSYEYTHLVWAYDDDGNQVREEERYTNNGVTLYVTTFEYEPAGFGYVVGEWPRDIP